MIKNIIKYGAGLIPNNGAPYFLFAVNMVF